MKIYTKTGDKGETGLIGGTRVSKSALRVEAYGEVDELNAVLGYARAKLTDESIKEHLLGLQRDLFAIGAQLADPRGQVEKKAEKAGVSEERVKELEAIIDRYDATCRKTGCPRRATFRIANRFPRSTKESLRPPPPA